MKPKAERGGELPSVEVHELQDESHCHVEGPRSNYCSINNQLPLCIPKTQTASSNRDRGEEKRKKMLNVTERHSL